MKQTVDQIVFSAPSELCSSVCVCSLDRLPVLEVLLHPLMFVSVLSVHYRLMK